MFDLLLLSFIISLVTIGIYSTTWRGMIFHKPSKWLLSKLPLWVCKPLFACSICMSSAWSLIFFAIFGFPDLILIPVVIFTAAGINTIATASVSNIIPDEEDK